MPSRYIEPTEEAPQEAPQEKMSAGDYIRLLLATGTRVAGPWLGTIAGGALGTLADPIVGPLGTAGGAVLGGGAGGALSEALAERIEPHNTKGINPGRVAVAGGLGAIPGSWLIRSGKPLASAAIGAGVGYAGVAGNKLAEGEGAEKSLNPLEWSPAEAVLGPGAGGVLGGVLGKVSKPHGPAPTPKPEVKLTPEQIKANLEKVGGRVDLDTKVWPSPPKTETKGPKPGSEQLDQARKDAVSVATPVGRRLAKAVTGAAKQDLKTASGDTRPSTTTPTPGQTFSPRQVITGTTEGGRFVVTDPEATGIIPVADRGSVVASGLPEEPSEATVKALSRSANPRMAQAQTTKARQAEAQAARAEVGADLQDVRTRQGGTDVGTVAQKVEKAQAANNVQNTRELTRDQRNLAQIQAAMERAKQLEAKSNTGEISRDQKNLQDVIAWREQVAKDRAAALAVEDAKTGLEPQEPSVVERTTATEGPTKTTKTVRYAPPAPEEGEEGLAGDLSGAGSPPSSYSADRVPTQEHVASTLYTSLQSAKKHADFYGGSPAGVDVVPVGSRKWRVKFPIDSAEPQVSAEEPTLPSLETETPSSNVPLDKTKVSYQNYTNRAEANAIAKATGGTVEQYGPRRYRVKFPDETTPTPPPVDEPITPSPTISLPKPTSTKFVPPPVSNEPLPKLDTGNLTPDEFRRMMNLQPMRGIVRTPEELAEWRQLMGKFNQKPPAVEVSDYTGGQPEHTVDVPPPTSKPEANPLTVEQNTATNPPRQYKGDAGQFFTFADEKAGYPKTREALAGYDDNQLAKFRAEEIKASFDRVFGHHAKKMLKLIEQELASRSSAVPQSEMSVEQFAQALSKEGEKPIAEVPFSLSGDKPPQGPAPVEQPLIETSLAEKVKGKRGAERKALKDANWAPVDESAAKLKQQGNSLLDSVAQPIVEPTPPVEAKPSTSWGEMPEDEDQALKELFRANGWGEPPAQGRSWAVPDEPTLTNTELNSSDLAKLKPEEQEKALLDEIAKWKGAKGESVNSLVIRLGLSAAGAAAGAATTPDDPITGALLGGAAGAFAPTVVKALISRARIGNLSESTLGQVASKVEDVTKTFFKMLPDYQRFVLLAHPINLPINMWVGPYGSALMGAIEHSLQGDERGLAALKVLANPVNFGKRYSKALNEAHTLIVSSEERTEGQLGKAGPEWFKKLTSAPGTGMTAGDLAARDILMEAGFTEPEARRITLTSEPYTAWGNAISKFKKGAQTEGKKRSFIVNMMLPFYRTSTNQIEQSLERTPGLGFLAQRYWKDIPDPIKSQFAQQFVGGNVAGASFLLGTVIPEDPKDDVPASRYIRKFLNDFTGQYGAIAGAAFVAGQAYGAGKSQIGAMQKYLTTQGGMPMPSTQPLERLGSNVRAFTENNPDKLKSPFAVLPGILDPKVPLSIPQAGAKAVELISGQPSTTSGIRIAPPPRTSSQSTGRSRYIPPPPASRNRKP